ncbi:MAG: response regulator [Anaerolineae bacterium]|nr:response regulator [Anaerolineae bacterium]
MAGERVLIVDPDRATLSYLAALLTQEGYDVTTAMLGREAREKAALLRPDLVIVERELSDMEGLDLVRELRSHPGTANVGIIVFSKTTDVGEILTFLEAGADEHVIKRPGADREILARVQVLLTGTRRPAHPQEQRKGKIISFFSAKGGTGTSAVCANLACALAERAQPKTVAVVDLVLPLGSMRQILGVDSPESIATLTQLPAEDIDTTAVARAMAAAKGWRVQALLGARDPDEAQSLRVDPLEPIFATLRTMFDYTLVDFGRSLSRVSLPIIRKSEMVVVVMGVDVNTVHLTKTCLDYFQRVGIARSQLFVVINRAVGLAGLTKDQIETTLRLPVAGTIPYGGADFTLLLNQAKPFVSVHPNQTVSIMVRELAEDLQMRVDRL